MRHIGQLPGARCHAGAWLANLGGHLGTRGHISNLLTWGFLRLQQRVMVCETAIREFIYDTVIICMLS